MPNRTRPLLPSFLLRRRPSSRGRSNSGYTLLEILFVLAILGILATLTIPFLLKTMAHATMDGAIHSLLSTLSQARAEAVRRGVPVVVTADLGANRLDAFADVNNDGVFNPDPLAVYRNTDYEIASNQLPTSGATGVFFWGVADDSPGGADAVNGFPADRIIFERDGSLRDTGSLRVAMGPYPRTVAPENDYQRNYYELATKLQAVGRFEVRKWVPPSAEYEVRSKSTDGTPNWKWY